MKERGENRIRHLQMVRAVQVVHHPHLLLKNDLFLSISCISFISCGLRLYAYFRISKVCSSRISQFWNELIKC